MYRVLLVEDDSQIRQVIGDYFGRRDQIALDFAEDGNIGLSKFLNGSYDLIVLDIMMPGLDGFELCKIIGYSGRIPDGKSEGGRCPLRLRDRCRRLHR